MSGLQARSLIHVPPLSTRYRTALVTGVSGGLGRAFAEMLLAEGVTVWGTARSYERLGSFTGRKGFTPLLLDLAQAEQIDQAHRAGSEQAGGAFDLVINNAAYGVFGAFAVTPFSGWRAQIEAGLIGTAHLAHLALRSMAVQNRGCLVNVSSVAVEYPLPFMAGYNMVKAGLSALSESLIFEVRGSDVRVIDFRPGDYRTAFNTSMQVTSAALEPTSDPRLARAWQTLEANIAAAPLPTKAASDLRRALGRNKSGTVYSGGFFQVVMAPLFSRLVPSRVRRAVAARYFGAT